jgi:lipopolysaccharide biosynthesis glycosyltransferase
MPPPVAIVFAADNYYVPYMAATMQSIMENAGQNRLYIFYILYQKISYDNIELLKKQITPFPQFSIEFINVVQHISKYNFYVSRHITVESYFRLLIPELLGEYRKVIYLDGDMICCTDIATLFDIDLEDHLLAAAWAAGVAWYYSPNHSEHTTYLHSSLIASKNPNEYFCAGTCVFNIELFRKTISTGKLLELAVSREWQYHDQDILNYLSEGKRFFCPIIGILWPQLMRNTCLNICKMNIMTRKKTPGLFIISLGIMIFMSYTLSFSGNTLVVRHLLVKSLNA